MTSANALTRPIHDRMPVIIGEELLPTWLSGTQADDLLKSAPEDLLRMWPVSRRVNRVGNDNDRTLIDMI